MGIPEEYTSQFCHCLSRADVVPKRKKRVLKCKSCQFEINRDLLSAWTHACIGKLGFEERWVPKIHTRYVFFLSFISSFDFLLHVVLIATSIF